MKELDKHFDYKTEEPKIYEAWEKSGNFNPDKQQNVKKNKKPFTIIMPPPNANGSLHAGHAVFVTLEDIMIRYHRMLGEPTLWLPGTDHAGFETQVVFEKKLEKEGSSRFQYSRDELYQKTWDFTQLNKKHTISQLRSLGSSCDWSREKFTLDKDIVNAVCRNFKKLYDEKMVYRDNRPVNWCTKHQTSLSDLEIKSIEKKDPLYYIKYGPITLATVRPETKFGDTAVAVNPKDKRYKKYLGKKIKIKTLIGPATIKVIADSAVDPKFGTGALKVTPAHAQEDFEIWQRHKKEIEGARAVIDQYGKLDLLSHWPENKLAKKYHGLKVLEAREKIVNDLKKEGLLVKIDDNYTHILSTCYKCGKTIEPRILPQWFVRTKPLAKLGLGAIKSGKVKFVTPKYEKIYRHWLTNIRDWNISRQIVWGIRIPAWYPKSDSKNQNIYIGQNPPKGYIQDPDVFDTWFSSGQWPFITLQTGKKNDFKKFYPTTVMETGWDILFFWVARMIMLGLYFTGKVPFYYIYLHGLVRDKDRQKMSKSRGNVIDPLGVAKEYGVDALRLALIFGVSAGNDTCISEEKIRGARNFVTKIWNASRFVMMQLKDFNAEVIRLGSARQAPPILSKYDEEEIKKLNDIIKSVTKNIDQYKFGQAAEEIYSYFWHHFCDKVIENCKDRIYNPANPEDKKSAQYLLYTILKNSLKLLHPFTPFVTEAVWQKLRLAISDKRLTKFIMISNWPSNHS